MPLGFWFLETSIHLHWPSVGQADGKGVLTPFLLTGQRISFFHGAQSKPLKPEALY